MCLHSVYVHFTRLSHVLLVIHFTRSSLTLLVIHSTRSSHVALVTHSVCSPQCLCAHHNACVLTTMLVCSPQCLCAHRNACVPQTSGCEWRWSLWARHSPTHATFGAIKAPTGPPSRLARAPSPGRPHPFLACLRWATLLSQVRWGAGSLPCLLASPVLLAARQAWLASQVLLAAAHASMLFGELATLLLLLHLIASFNACAPVTRGWLQYYPVTILPKECLCDSTVENKSGAHITCMCVCSAINCLSKERD